ncbi:MAG: insulinase family protein, partial [Deltaproteobacteria bacterium]
MGYTTQRDFAQAAAVAGRDGGAAWRLTGFHRHGERLSAARFSLPNGLKVVLQPDDRAPIFAYQSWFRVGSKHEDPQRTGLAHLFEHLMFKGTRTFPSGTLDAEMEARGAQTNAATWVDWTHYTQA